MTALVNRETKTKEHIGKRFSEKRRWRGQQRTEL